MFSAALGIPKQTPFRPTNPPKMEVSFRPLTQPDGYKQYVALIETEEELVIKDDSVRCSNEETDTIYSSATTPPAVPKDPLSLGGDPINTFYIGSITVLGLYLLYRILNRAK
jgi:hypothetical protein